MLAPWLTWRVPVAAVWCDCRRTTCCLVAAVILKQLARPGGVAAAVLPALDRRGARQRSPVRLGDGKLHLTVMDVGQGDAMLVTLPNGRTLMVDTGGVSFSGEFDIGDRVLGPALRASGIARLDYLAITHGDPDHIGGAASLVRDFSPVGDLVRHFRQQPPAVDDSCRRWRREDDRRGDGCRRGDRMDLGGVELRVHHPRQPDWQRQKVRNDDSLVIELRYGQVSVLLTGDIGREVEQALIPTLDLLPTVVLKSPHHGSGTSSSDEFIRETEATAGADQLRPSESVRTPGAASLERYQQTQSQVFRTDRTDRSRSSRTGRVSKSRHSPDALGGAGAH